MAEVHGSCDDRFAGVREASRASSTPRSSARRSPSTSRRDRRRPLGRLPRRGADDALDRGHVVNVWSTTKRVLNLAALMLVERGELDVYAPVGDYWPEFSANGKKNVEVRHLMSHTSGSRAGTSRSRSGTCTTGRSRPSGWPAAPWWEPGTASGYHAKNQGHLVGEVSAGSRTRRSRSSSPTRSPARWGRISRSAPRRGTGSGSRPSSPRRREEDRGDRPHARWQDVHRAGRVGEGGELAGVAAGRPRRAERALERPRAC